MPGAKTRFSRRMIDAHFSSRHPVPMRKPGRNDSCPCGSGKKSKKCCLPKEEAALPRRIVAEREKDFITELRPELVLETSSYPSLDACLANAQLFDEAFQCLAGRQFKQAVELFERVLSQNPRHVQSHGNTALAYAGLGRRSEAMACLERALELDPGYEPALYNRRLVEQMPDGEPLIPDGMAEVNHYADRFRHAAGKK
jgi:tetratricopeptide (TPR) repeat protein